MIDSIPRARFVNSLVPISRQCFVQTGRVTSGLLLAIAAFGQPVAAQPEGGAGNVCETQMGGFIEAVTLSFGTLQSRRYYWLFSWALLRDRSFDREHRRRR